MNNDTRTQLSCTTVLLHWIVAIGVMGMLTIGVYMVKNEAYAFYPWHKSFGQVIFVFAVAQVAWRFKNGWPEPVREYLRIEQLLARTVHYALLMGVLLMPVFGFLMSVFGGNGVDFFGLELVARNLDPVNPDKTIPINGSIAGLTNTAHWVVGYLLIAAIALHIAGALKHHVIDKDGTLRRMLGKKV